MPLGKFILFSTAGALPWSIALVYAGMQLGANWAEIREILRPFDLAILDRACIVVFVAARSGGGSGCRACGASDAGRPRPRPTTATAP